MTTDSSVATDFSNPQNRRDFVAKKRQEVADRQASGASGIEICNWYSDQMDYLLQQMMTLSLATYKTPATAKFALICVGANGRRRPAPFSDVDLLLVCTPAAVEQMEAVLSVFVRDCWDTGLQLGHSIRTPDDVVQFANEDIQFATSLVDMRFLMGQQQTFDQLHSLVQKKVFRNPVDRFVDACVASRREEWLARGDSVNQLEPDIKRSPGGLRDLHLIRWVTYAQFSDSNPTSLLEHNSISKQELAVLHQADEFLTSLRLELHCRAGLKQDVLTRDLQLEIVRSRGEVGSNFRKPIEKFMREYFRQTSRVAEIARRVTETEHRPSLLSRIKGMILSARSPKGFSVQDGVLHVDEKLVDELEKDPESVMDVFTTAAKHQVVLPAELRHAIGMLAAGMPSEPSRKSCRQFRAVLRSGLGLPSTLRAMYETKVLDWLIPQVSEIRCLMQFNQYHSYTVDEHTLKTIDEVVTFEEDDGPLGSAYKSVRHKATLHTALILHDVGKGRDGDHSIIGEEIADEVGVRLQFAEHKKQMMMFLVRQHLVMPDLAFRRDLTDQAMLMEFARLVGAPESLRMLYVLSVADIKAVGPDVWTDWKGDLLADLYNRTMLILSGRPVNHLERERLQLVREHVKANGAPAAEKSSANWTEWIESQLDALPPFYLMMEEPDQIAHDLESIRELTDTEVRIEGAYDGETDTVTYHIVASREYEGGSFHKISGLLSGLRMDIHGAQSCTTQKGTLVASFLVSDNDFIGQVSDFRIQEVCSALSDVLTNKTTVEHVFRRSGLFRMKRPKVIQPVAPHVSIDNDCSENHTVIDVFAMDSPGLLYTLALVLYQHNLSVQLTRIATNVDQVVDVFYVVDEDGKKIKDVERLNPLRKNLMDELQHLQDELVN